MNTFDLKDNGPFTPEETAKRLMLASKQLKWFTLCQPYWESNHIGYSWKTTFPLPPLDIPKGVRLTWLGPMEGAFDISKPKSDSLAAAFKALAKLAGLAECQISIHINTDRKESPGLTYFRFTLTPAGDWKIKVSAFHPKPETVQSSLKRAVEAFQLTGIEGWERPSDRGELELEQQAKTLNFTNVLCGVQADKWVPAIKDMMAAQPKRPKSANWQASSQKLNLSENNLWEGNHNVWVRTDGKPVGANRNQPQEMLQLIRNAGMPAGKAEIDLSCTVDRVEDFIGLFKLAVVFPNDSPQPVGVFETERGKKGVLQFNTQRNRIRLSVAYDRYAGWEELHEALRKADGKLPFPKDERSRRQSYPFPEGPEKAVVEALNNEDWDTLKKLAPADSNTRGSSIKTWKKCPVAVGELDLDTAGNGYVRGDEGATRMLRFILRNKDGSQKRHWLIITLRKRPDGQVVLADFWDVAAVVG